MARVRRILSVPALGKGGLGGGTTRSSSGARRPAHDDELQLQVIFSCAVSYRTDWLPKTLSIPTTITKSKGLPWHSWLDTLKGKQQEDYEFKASLGYTLGLATWLKRCLPPSLMAQV